MAKRRQRDEVTIDSLIKENEQRIRDTQNELIRITASKEILRSYTESDNPLSHLVKEINVKVKGENGVITFKTAAGEQKMKFIVGEYMPLFGNIMESISKSLATQDERAYQTMANCKSEIESLQEEKAHLDDEPEVIEDENMEEELPFDQD